MKREPQKNLEMAKWQDLADYLKKYLQVHQLSVKKFIGRLIKQSPGTTISANAVIRLLSNKGKPHNATIAKIATFLCNEPGATELDLFKLIGSNHAAKSPNELKIVTGFTVWSSYIISMLQSQIDDPEVQRIFPEGIKFSFCSQSPSGDPQWMGSREDLNGFRQPGNHPRYKFIANDLFRLIEEGKADGVLLLRSTFDYLPFNPNLPKPVLVSRILVGHGTHMYIIGKKRPGEVQNNCNHVVNNAWEIVETKKDFIKKIRGKKVRTVYIDNPTISKDKGIFFQDDELIYRAMDSTPDPIDIGIGKYHRQLEELGKQFEKDDINYLLVLAFAPFNNIIFHDLQRVTSVELFYENYNLSKLAEDKSSYNFYASHEALNNPSKLKLMGDFLTSLDTHVTMSKGKPRAQESLAREISEQLSDLYYYPDGITQKYKDLGRKERMVADLKEIEYSNQSIDIFNHFLRLLKKYGGI